MRLLHCSLPTLRFLLHWSISSCRASVAFPPATPSSLLPDPPLINGSSSRVYLLVREVIQGSTISVPARICKLTGCSLACEISIPLKVSSGSWGALTDSLHDAGVCWNLRVTACRASSMLGQHPHAEPIHSVTFIPDDCTQFFFKSEFPPFFILTCSSSMVYILF